MRLDAVRGYERGPDADVERTAGASVVGGDVTRRAIVARRRLATGQRKAPLHWDIRARLLGPGFRRAADFDLNK